jgi:hypothetical protein
VRVRGFGLAAALAVAVLGVPPAVADDLPVPVPGPTGSIPASSAPIPAPSFEPRLAPPPSDCTIEGDDGPNRLMGTPGPDVICGEGGDDVLEGLEGDDYLDGGDGVDTATWETSLCCVHADLSAGVASGSLGTDQLEGIENITGSQGTDVIRGDAAANTLFAGGHTDLVFGGDGDDWLLGGDGDDWLAGEGGTNILDGGTGANLCPDGQGTFCDPADPADAADTRGPLDIALVDPPGDQSSTTWRVSVRGRIKPMRLWDEGYALLSFDTAGGEEFEVHAVVRWERRRALGLLIRDGSRSASGKVQVRRAGPRGILVTVPLGQLGLDPQRLYFRWAAETIFTGPGCRPCLDGVPDARGYPQPLVWQSGP